jgi:hypothetical protein
MQRGRCLSCGADRYRPLCPDASITPSSSAEGHRATYCRTASPPWKPSALSSHFRLPPPPTSRSRSSSLLPLRLCLKTPPVVWLVARPQNCRGRQTIEVSCARGWLPPCPVLARLRVRSSSAGTRWDAFASAFRADKASVVSGAGSIHKAVCISARAGLFLSSRHRIFFSAIYRFNTQN